MTLGRPLVAALLAASLQAQGDEVGVLTEVVVLAEGEAPPVIDGELDDPVWEGARRLGPLVQVLPVEGAPASEETDVRLIFGPRHVYLYLKCFDRDPAGIRASLSRRDANLDPDDRVEWLFDTFHDGRNAFWFQIGAGGSLGDALITKNGSRFDKRWDTLWRGEARVTDEGWQAEVAIPTASLNFDPETEVWGFNLRRHVRRKREEVRWAATRTRVPFFDVTQAGELDGIRGLEQGLGLDLRPFTVGRVRRDLAGDWDEDLDGGLDVFYRLSPSTKLALTFNTDFAETEVDDRLVNLTRFPLFFPERRDFFLEDAGAFFFGANYGSGETSPTEPFFSRRIGLDANGREVPIDVAAKLTSTSDASNLGVLAARTGATDTLDAQELFVGRFSKNLGEESDVGVLWTHGDPAGGDREDTYGVDLNLRTTEFRGDRNLRFSSFLLRSDPDGGEAGDAWYAGLSYPNDEVSWWLSASGVDAAYDPALGFVRRRGVRNYAGRFAWLPRLNTWIRRVGVVVQPELVLDQDNDLRSVDVALQPLVVETDGGEELVVEVQHRREVLDAAFEISDGVVVDQAAYTFDRVELSFETDDRRALAVGATVGAGEFFDGRRDDYALATTLRSASRGTLTLGYELNDVRLPAGDFRVHVASLDASLQFGPTLSWSNVVQWDNRSDQLGLNSRLWWIPRPGTELFLVYNQGWDWDTSSFAPLESEVALKVGTTLRF